MCTTIRNLTRGSRWIHGQQVSEKCGWKKVTNQNDNWSSFTFYEVLPSYWNSPITDGQNTVLCFDFMKLQMRRKQANGMCYRHLSSQICYFCLDEETKISFFGHWSDLLKVVTTNDSFLETISLEEPRFTFNICIFSSSSLRMTLDWWPRYASYANDFWSQRRG